MTNQEIASIFVHISEILDIQGENPFKIRAYIKASQTIESLIYELSSLEDKNKIAKLPGIGGGIAQKIEELLETGKLKYYEELKRSEYGPLTEFLKISGMGPKHAKLGIKTVEALKEAAEEGKLRKLHGLGEKAEQNILQGIQQVQKYKERLPLAFVYPRAQNILGKVKKFKEIKEVMVAGSLRRMRETIADVDILASSDHPEKVMEAFVNLPQADKVVAKGKTKSSIVTKEGFQVDLRVVPPESFGAATHYFTGSKAHNIRIRSLGVDNGLKINEYGVFRKRTDKKIAGLEEEDVYGALGLKYIPAELREDAGEIECAKEDRLPKLVEPRDIRADLHVHSEWSDGTHSLKELAKIGKEKGYEYIAICDHTKSLPIAGGLNEKEIKKQINDREN